MKELGEFVAERVEELHGFPSLEDQVHVDRQVKRLLAQLCMQRLEWLEGRADVDAEAWAEDMRQALRVIAMSFGTHVGYKTEWLPKGDADSVTELKVLLEQYQHGS